MQLAIEVLLIFIDFLHNGSNTMDMAFAHISSLVAS